MRSPGEELFANFNEGWIRYFFDIANVVSSKSKDPTTKVGCIVVNDSKRILATGFNGLPIGVNDDPELYPERYDRDMDKYKYVSHAEANAIAFAASEGVSLKGGHMFVTLHPCVECTKLIIMAGIKTIHAIDCESSATDGWRKDLKLAQSMLTEAGVRLYRFDKKLRQKI